MKLDVGCGNFCRGDVGVDVAKTQGCDVVADAHFLPFRRETFTGLHAQCVLEHLRDPTQGLCEFMRVLKLGGQVTIIVPKPWLTNNVFSKLVKTLLDLPFSLLPQNLWYQFKSSWRAKTQERWRHKSIVTFEYMEGAGRKNGFQIVSFTEMEDSLLNFLYFFHRRHMFKRFFEFKPKFYHLHKFVLRKNNVQQNG